MKIKTQSDTTVQKKGKNMNFIEDIFKKHDRIKRSKPVEFDLYPLSEQLFDEFDRIGVIERLKAIPQLGSIPVSQNLQKSRYDYVVLQIWLHKKAHDLIVSIQPLFWRFEI